MTSTPSKTPASGGQVGSVDAGLVELEKRRNELLHGTEADDAKVGETALQEPLSDEDAAEQLSALDAVERQIATGPAKGLEGVAVKLRVATSLFEESKTPDEPALPEWDCVKTATETVERLATVNEAADAEIVSLWHEYLVLEDRGNVAYEANNEDEGEALFVQARERRERILEIQARAPAGIAVKLKIAEKSDGSERAVLSALHDLERLSGPFVPAVVDARLLELSRQLDRSCKAHLAATKAKEQAEAAMIEAHPDLFDPHPFMVLEALPNWADASLEEMQSYMAPRWPAPLANKSAGELHALFSEHGERIKDVLAEYGWAALHEREQETHAQERTAFFALMRVPAQSLDGILVKLKAVFFEDERAEFTEALAGAKGAYLDKVCLGAVFADLERLAGRSAPVATVEKEGSK